jgi:integrase
MVDGERTEKLFPDHSKQSQMAAIQWEMETKDLLRMTDSSTPTVCSTEAAAVEVTVKTWAVKYLDFVKTRFVKKTYDEKVEAFKKQLLEYPAIDGFTLVRDITVGIAEEILKKRFESGSGYSANKLRKNMSAAWTWGAKYLDHFPAAGNPFWKIDPFPEIESPRYVPPEEDFLTLYGYVSRQEGIIAEQDKTILLTFLHCAGRRGEIWRIKMSDLDFSNGRIRLWTRKRKNGNYQSDWLPMTTELRENLRRWVEVRLGMDTRDKDHLFVALEKTTVCDGYYGMPFTNRQHFMKRNCVRAGVQPFGFHAIRHLTASILFKKGYRLGTIQALLRHASKTTTERYLRSLGIEEVRADLEEAFSRPPGIQAEIIDLNSKKKSA